MPPGVFISVAALFETGIQTALAGEVAVNGMSVHQGGTGDSGGR